ncbi:MAG TPA: hypothetical protein DHW02_19605 [Ktedonobacter sp.]|nr:hypothetical protein [Ktedonobacter sp.]
MERVLIVARTRMGSGVCVGGLVLDSNRSVRLLTREGALQPRLTEFQVGQIWDVNFRRVANVEPPHVEDVMVFSQQLLETVDNMQDMLLAHIQPWTGGPESLFDRMLTIDRTRCYVSHAKPVPQRSTGLWLLDRPLVFDKEHVDKTQIRHMYLMQYKDHIGNRAYTRTLTIPFVGYQRPIDEIPVGTLVRISLARWFAPSSVGEERCYLQLSGWYS